VGANTIGKLVVKKFLKQGYMKHDLQAIVPGSPESNKEGTVKEAVDILKNSIQ
jgi:hypothetical protein